MKDWSEILLSPEDSIQTTIKIIHTGKKDYTFTLKIII
jgi:hypothetical protein